MNCRFCDWWIMSARLSDCCNILRNVLQQSDKIMHPLILKSCIHHLMVIIGAVPAWLGPKAPALAQPERASALWILRPDKAVIQGLAWLGLRLLYANFKRKPEDQLIRDHCSEMIQALKTWQEDKMSSSPVAHLFHQGICTQEPPHWHLWVRHHSDCERYAPYISTSNRHNYQHPNVNHRKEGLQGLQRRHISHMEVCILQGQRFLLQQQTQIICPDSVTVEQVEWPAVCLVQWEEKKMM
jgi:hypothetical protein